MEAGCVVQGKGRKANRIARKNCALRRGQRRPKLCLGETYAESENFYLRISGLHRRPLSATPSLVATSPQSSH
jgi:hypothetical protein